MMALMLRYMRVAIDSDGIETVQNDCTEIRLAGVRCRRRCHVFIYTVMDHVYRDVAMVVNHEGRHYHTS